MKQYPTIRDASAAMIRNRLNKAEAAPEAQSLYGKFLAHAGKGTGPVPVL